MFAVPEESAIPKLLAGLLIQFWTRAVTSNVTYCPGVAAVKVVEVAPIVGIEANVTDDSPQVEVTGATLTIPAALTRFTNSVTVARETWLETMPGGNAVRSNWTSAVLPLPTYRLER